MRQQAALRAAGTGDLPYNSAGTTSMMQQHAVAVRDRGDFSHHDWFLSCRGLVPTLFQQMATVSCRIVLCCRAVWFSRNVNVFVIIT